MWDKLTRSLLERSNDTVVSVRDEVCSSLSRLQNPEEEDDEIRDRLIELIENDSSKQVRLSALTNICVNDYTIDKIIKRCNDIESDVRISAYKILKNRWNIQNLHINERIQIISQGLKDEYLLKFIYRDEKVRDAVIDLVCEGWLNDCEYNILTLLEKLDISNDTNPVLL